MKIADNPGLISPNAINILVNIARKTAPNGWKLNEAKAKGMVESVLVNKGACAYCSHIVCPDYCQNQSICLCDLYVKT